MGDQNTYTPQHIQDASFEAHMAAADRIDSDLGHKATPEDVAHALAHSYGESLAVFAAKGGQTHQLEAINRIAERSYKTMLTKIMADTCEGRA